MRTRNGRYETWYRHTLSPHRSKWLRTAFWRGAQEQAVRGMFQLPVTEQTRARWVRQVHAWFQEVVVKCST